MVYFIEVKEIKCSSCGSRYVVVNNKGVRCPRCGKKSFKTINVTKLTFDSVDDYMIILRHVRGVSGVIRPKPPKDRRAGGMMKVRVEYSEDESDLAEKVINTIIAILMGLGKTVYRRNWSAYDIKGVTLTATD
ncbi:MAG: hypothetical protein DRJ47_06670 [Thermoprotei archaeon]|nr:MAG: hypothetical protein DRJ47_06670 [Thermoprotei archaeon]